MARCGSCGQYHSLVGILDCISRKRNSVTTCLLTSASWLYIRPSVSTSHLYFPTMISWSLKTVNQFLFPVALFGLFYHTNMGEIQRYTNIISKCVVYTERAIFLLLTSSLALCGPRADTRMPSCKHSNDTMPLTNIMR